LFVRGINGERRYALLARAELPRGGEREREREKGVGGEKKKGVNILCNGREREDGALHRAERERKSRNGGRDGTTQRPATMSRARRASRHYLERAIKCRQRRVRGTDGPARLDSRINDSDVPWRNAFRTAARLMSADGECDCSGALT